MLIALAGPLVNLGIALLVGAVLAVLEPVPLTWFDQIRLLDTPGVNSLLRYIFLTNILLFIFNLLPAFPMDGGRIVRGGLATLFDFSLETRVAGGLAIFLSVALALYAVFRVKNVAMIILLLILAGITVMGAVQEIMVVRRRRALVLLRIGDITDLSTVNLAPWDEIDSSLLKRIIRDESTIPVLVDGRVVGVLNYRHLRRQIPGHKRETVAHLMESTFPVVTVQDTLWAAFREMVAVRLTGLPVMDGEQYAGMLTVRHIERAAQYRPRRVEVRKNL
jgi:CBS domain-containing protein